MGTLIVDFQIHKEVDLLKNHDILNGKYGIVEFSGKINNFKREIELLKELIKYKEGSLYFHYIVNYHNTYKFDDLIFRGCLPLKTERQGRKTVLKMLYTKQDKVEQDYLDFYTNLFDAIY